MEGSNHLWNIKHLHPPPVSTYKINTLTGIGALSHSFKAANIFFANLKHLHAEAAMLSRTIYRMKMKYRTDKGFKYLIRLNRCLLQYLGMDFGSTINTFNELIPKSKSLGVYMPSRNMLDYVLVRLQGLTMLLSRTIDTSELTAYFMEHKISYGHYWKMDLVILSITSRIWFIAKGMIKFCNHFYLSALKVRSHIEVVGPQWIPDNYQFPDNLENWLKEHRTSEINKYEGTSMQNTQTKLAQRFYESQANSFTNNSTESGTDISELDIQMSNNNFYSMMQKDDIGQVVSRLVQNETDDVNNVLKNYEDMAENINKNSSSKVDQMQVKDELPAGGQQVKTNILNDYLEAKRRARTYQPQKRYDYTSLTKENNFHLKETEIILGNQCESIKVESPKTEMSSFNQKDKQEPLVQIKKKNKVHDSGNIDNILESMNSIGDLNIFLKRQTSSRNDMKKCLSSKLDRLQWHMLEKEIKKCIKKANKVGAHSEDYLIRAKDLLKVSLS